MKDTTQIVDDSARLRISVLEKQVAELTKLVSDLSKQVTKIAKKAYGCPNDI